MANFLNGRILRMKYIKTMKKEGYRDDWEVIHSHERSIFESYELHQEKVENHLALRRPQYTNPYFHPLGMLT